MKLKSMNLAISIAGALGLLATLTAQDSVQLKDGRFVMDKKMTRDAKGVTIHFDNGKVFIPAEKILSTTALDASGKGAPVSAADRERLAKGLVRHGRRWVRKSVRDRALERLRAKRKKKIAYAKLHQSWDKRHFKKTQNFEFEFTLDPELMQNYMDLMETYFKVFTKEWGIRKPPRTKRLKVCFYHNEEMFLQIGGAPAGVIGYFKHAPPELNFFFERMDEGLTIDVMFHEVNHYLTYLIKPRFNYPAWVNESLAEYYGASEWNPKTKKMKLGGIQEGRLAVIQDAIGTNLVSKRTADSSGGKDRWLGLEEMIRIPSFAAVHYAWGWSFVHFLLSNKQYAGRFKKYYLALARSSSIKKKLARGYYSTLTVGPDEQIKWLLKYLGVKSLDLLEQEWYRHILSLKSVSARGYHYAGLFAYSRNMPIKAQRLLKIAIDMKSENPMTWAYLGKAQSRKRKYQEASASFDTAISMDPLNGMFYILKARCLDKGGAEDEASKLRMLALEVDPDNDTVVMEAAWDEMTRK